MCFYLIGLVRLPERAPSPAEQPAPIAQEAPILTDDHLKLFNIGDPARGNDCRLPIPLAPFWGAGQAVKQSWHHRVRNQAELATAIRRVNSHGGTIFIDATFDVTAPLPKITRDYVTILSKSGNIIHDKLAGGARASELFRVEGSNFTMKHVTIFGIGRSNPYQPSS